MWCFFLLSSNVPYRNMYQKRFGNEAWKSISTHYDNSVQIVSYAITHVMTSTTNIHIHIHINRETATTNKNIATLTMISIYLFFFFQYSYEQFLFVYRSMIQCLILFYTHSSPSPIIRAYQKKPVKATYHTPTGYLHHSIPPQRQRTALARQMDLTIRAKWLTVRRRRLWTS